MEEKN